MNSNFQKIKNFEESQEYIFEVSEGEYVATAYLANGTHGPIASFHLKKNNEVKRDLVTISKICRAYDSPHRGKEILREIAISKFIQHQNLVSLLDVIIPQKEEWQNLYLVYEYFPSNLERLIKAVDTFNYLNDKMLVPWIMYQIFNAVHYLHTSGIMHRNIKPSNILINEEGSIKLCGFGNARSFIEERCFENTIKGETNNFTTEVGRLNYRAPEILASKKKRFGEYNEKVDIWSIGCVMAELYKKEIFFNPRKSKSSWEAMLEEIFKLLGKPKKEELEDFASKERIKTIYKMYKNNENSENKDIKNLFPEGTDLNAIDLIKQLLTINPKKRISIKDALNHKYFDLFFH